MWAEDAHGAATHVWQGLEAFKSGRGGLTKVLGLAPTYVEYSTRGIVEFLARRIRLQSQALAKHGTGTPDWYTWDSNRFEIKKLLGKVLDKRSINYYGKWKSPEAPELLFHPLVGILQTASRRLRRNGEDWMWIRLEADLRLLYGIRNRVVHAGQRVLPWQMAMHLGQLGAEILFTLMEARVTSLPAPAGPQSALRKQHEVA